MAVDSAILFFMYSLDKIPNDLKQIVILLNYTMPIDKLFALKRSLIIPSSSQIFDYIL